MSIFPSKPITHFLSFAAVLAAIAGAVLLLARDTQTTSGIDGGPEMRLVVVEPEGACDADGVCQFAELSEFTLGVEIVEAPEQGYIEAASYIFYGSDITYDPAARSAAEEIVWPECDSAIALRSQIDRTRPAAGVGGSNTDEAVNHGCLTGFFPPLPVSSYVGILLEILLTCSEGPSLSEIELLPVGDPVPGTSGAKFKFIDPADINLTGVTIIPKLSGLTVRCGEPPTPTPTATITPGGPTLTPLPSPTPSATPTVTPTPTMPLESPTPTVISVLPCGDVNGDFMVDSQDALWVLWFASNQIIHLPFPGDIDGDGITGPVDALYILWIALNLYLCR